MANKAACDSDENIK